MNKKEKVISVARDLFSKYGYKKVSMDAIAKSSNVTKKTIYTYFKDKESLFKYFIVEELKKMKELIEKRINNTSSFSDNISILFYEILLFRNNSILIQSIVQEVNETKDLVSMELLKFYDDEIINYLESLINKEIELGNIKKCNPHLTAFIIYKVYLAVMFEYDDTLNEKEVTKELISILKEGLFN